MPRQNTRLESEGAEFLVLGHLLIEGIAAYKTYTNMPGYDLVATNPESGRLARIQVKSRWRTNAPGFIINSFDCDFVVTVRLNRGSKKGTARKGEPEFFVLPVSVVQQAPRSENWGKVMFRHIPGLDRYRNDWDRIRLFLQSGSEPTSR